MKTAKMLVFLMMGVCMPATGFAALDWNIRWDDAKSPQLAKVYIFNPEYNRQSFSLEIGDVAKTADADPAAPHLIIGQDVSLSLAPSERKIFDIIVYQDIDATKTYASMSEEKMYWLSSDSYRVIGQKYEIASSRQYPISLQNVVPVPREDQSGNQYQYRSGRGYWTVTLSDHDYVLEQLVRTGYRINASHNSIQEAILYYTQGSMQLSKEAITVWETTFPELRVVDVSPPQPIGDCARFVIFVTTNQSYYASSRIVTTGDVLASNDPQCAPVVAGDDLSYSVSANTPTSKRVLRIYLLTQRNQPTSRSEYVSIMSHSSQIEQVIRIGTAENYHACAIQDVIFYVNREVAAPTTGKGLWDRMNGQITPIPPISTPGQRSLCLGNPTTTPRLSGNMTFKNLAVLVGVIVPFGFIYRRKGRK